MSLPFDLTLPSKASLEPAAVAELWSVARSIIVDAAAFAAQPAVAVLVYRLLTLVSQCAWVCVALHAFVIVSMNQLAEAQDLPYCLT